MSACRSRLCAIQRLIQFRNPGHLCPRHASSGQKVLELRVAQSKPLIAFNQRRGVILRLRVRRATVKFFDRP
ncbi:hypothetical protein CBS147346_9750 [Aspergillus niger]|nr:hypothetical protein CBS147346_9750 [Aspergillus niger]